MQELLPPILKDSGDASETIVRRLQVWLSIMLPPRSGCAFDWS